MELGETPDEGAAIAPAWTELFDAFQRACQLKRPDATETLNSVAEALLAVPHRRASVAHDRLLTTACTALVKGVLETVGPTSARLARPRPPRSETRDLEAASYVLGTRG